MRRRLVLPVLCALTLRNAIADDAASSDTSDRNRYRSAWMHQRVFPNKDPLSSLAGWHAPRDPRSYRQEVESHFGQQIHHDHQRFHEGEIGSIPQEEFHRTPFYHKPLLPLDHKDFIGLFLAIIGLMIAAGGGIGGGGVLVPLYILVLRFSSKYAIPLSNITIFGGSIINTLLNMGKRHPLADRPMVDWDLILVMEPLTIGGALLGSFLNKLLPEWLLNVLLVLLLAATARRTLLKGKKLYAKESREMEFKLAEQEGQATKGDYGTAAVAPVEGSANAGAAGDPEAPVEQPVEPVLRSILEAEKSTDFHKVGKLVVVFAGVLVLEVAKGGGAFPSPLGLECGGVGYWALTLATLPWVLYWMLDVRKGLVAMYHKKQIYNYQYVEGDIMWDERNTIRFPAMCTVAGIFAGMFGIGGGIVKGPLMLEMGVHPMVASATSACMILYTTSTATVSFMLFGLMQMDYAIFLFCVGIFSTFVGQKAINRMIKQTGRASYVIFSIGIIVALSAFFMGIEGIYSVFARNVRGNHESGICTVGA